MASNLYKIATAITPDGISLCNGAHRSLFHVISSLDITAELN
jgi:hypothetical protein